MGGGGWGWEALRVDPRVVPAHLHLSVELVQIRWSGKVMLCQLFDKENKQISISHGEHILICAPAWRKGYFFALCNL